MGWLISIILTVVYFWQGGINNWMIISASIFGIAGAIELGFEKIKKIINSKYTYDALMNNEDTKKMYIDFIKEELVKNHYGSNKNDNINYFKHRDD